MKFTRLIEFCDTINASTPTNDIRVHLKSVMKSIPNVLIEYENLLDKLDAKTWEIVKQKLLSRTIKHDIRGWSQFYDTFAEVSGFCYLLEAGYTNINFIPEVEKMRTPDIEAIDPIGKKCLLESKNIGFSDDERKYILENTKRLSKSEKLQTRSVTQGMPEGLKNKLKSTIQSAKEQLVIYSHNDTSIKKFLYLTIQLDIHMYLDMRNFTEVTNYIRKLTFEETEIEIISSSLSAV